MPAPDGKRTSLASYTWGGWGSQNDITRFRDTFQPDPRNLFTRLSASAA
jgi:hypothetical protein